MKLGSIFKQTLGTIAAVAVPAFGGKLAADVAKHALPNVVGSLPNPVVDAAGGLVAAALTIGGAYALGGKGAAGRAIPFAVAGAAMGVAMPYWDNVIDSATKAVSGTVTASSAGAAKAVTAGATPGGFRVLPGGQGTGQTLPGGDGTGSTLPGGRREGVSSVRMFAAPGGAMW